MKLLVDDDKFKLLLEKRKQYIGRKVTFDALLSSVSFLISVLLASYENLPIISGKINGVVFKTIFVILGVVFTLKSIYDINKDAKDNYSYEDLLMDVNNLNEIAHEHSIVIVMNTYDKHPNKYLVYDDARWDCPLFLNYKTSENNEEHIIGRLSGDLKIDALSISLKFIANRVHDKYSHSSKETKLYNHSFYLANIDKFSSTMKNATFELDSKTYHWMTLDELKQNEKVIEKNLDIVKMVEEMI